MGQSSAFFPGNLENPTMNGVKILPDEVLALICEDLGQQRDFSTLFKCAQTCTTLADPALRTMYR